MALKRGFSLIELTVVVGLLGVLTLAISTIMLTSIVTSNRIRTTTKVKQAGNYALGQIQTLLRNAKSVVFCDSTNAAITIVNPDGGVTLLTSEVEGDNTRIASGSGYYLTPDNVTTTTFNLACEPSDTEPKLVKVSFELQDTVSSSPTQNPILHFETSINLRNE